MTRNRNSGSGTSGAEGRSERFDFGQMLTIGDSLPMAMAFVDCDLRYRFVNKALAKFLGWPRDEMIGRTMAEVLDPDVLADRLPMIEAAMAGERQWFAADFDHPERGLLAIQSEYLPQRGPGGAVFGVAMLINDVTEQRITERALKESEARFRRIADSAPAMMWVTRLDRSRDFVNDAYIEFVGLPREEARGYDWRLAIHPEDVDRLIAESLAGEATGDKFTLEGRYRRWDGEYRWLSSVSQPRFGPEGELVGFIGVASDITVTKEAELELRRKVKEQTAEVSASEARFRSVFDTVLEVLVLLKPDGTIVELNRKSASWRHPDPREAVGRKIWESPTMVAYPEHVPLVKQAIKRAASGELFNAEVNMEREGVPTANLDVSVQPVRDEAGFITYLLFEARDITELKSAQEQLRQSQKMEALGQLTGGIAHDFNNLLTVVVGGLDLIARKVTDPRLKRYAANALTAADRGARLTAQLLAFSRVQRLEVKPTLVAPLIEGMRPLLRNVLGPQIVKNFSLDSAMMPVMADPTQLELAVLNLAINSRDAMPGGGQLSIVTTPVQMEADPELDDGDYIELAVSDTGSGMSPDVVARAFDPFFTTKEVGKGTGLGLSMVYGVARQSGGTARIDSVPGEGTTIRLYFKRADGDAEISVANAVDSIDEPGKRNASILVVDDDPDVRGFIAASLADFGYRVREAADGASGLLMFATERPNLVILDFAMPGLSGGEIAERILKEAPGQAILFVSGYSETESIRRAAPNAQMLAKPFRPDALDAAVREALGK
ncbi:MAG: PAS domain S-box protein [Sphingomicrobium sp.]